MDQIHKATYIVKITSQMNEVPTARQIQTLLEITTGDLIKVEKVTKED